MATKSGITKVSSEIIPSSELPKVDLAVTQWDELAQLLVPIAKEAKELKIDSLATRIRAAELTATCKEYEKTSGNVAAPYKAILKKVSDFIQLRCKTRISDEAERIRRNDLAPKMAEWDQREERRAAAERDRARAAALKLEEKEIKADVKAGNLTKTEAHAVLAQAEQRVEQITVAPNIPKVAGNVRRVNYKFRVINPKLVPEEFWSIDEFAVGRYIREKQTLGTDVIPGIEVYEERTF